IRTRDGLPIARLMILGKDQEEAERKLMQMYHHCEIINCASDHQVTVKKRQNTFIESITSLLAKRDNISG
ncbi:MAG: hypothetical protein Q8L69_16990, partial [Gallionellaceae bacterium]|nr:hypothetical protein [Gallionellaceae bacterium]